MKWVHLVSKKVPVTRATLRNSAIWRRQRKRRREKKRSPLKYKTKSMSTYQQTKQTNKLWREKKMFLYIYSLCGFTHCITTFAVCLEKFRCTSHIHFDFLTFFSSAHLWYQLKYVSEWVCVCVCDRIFTESRLLTWLFVDLNCFYIMDGGSGGWASVSLAGEWFENVNYLLFL